MMYVLLSIGGFWGTKKLLYIIGKRETMNMKQTALEIGKAYSNGSKGKWNQERTITEIVGSTVFYKVTGGRDQEKERSMTKAGFAQWAEKQV